MPGGKLQTKVQYQIDQKVVEITTGRVGTIKLISKIGNEIGYWISFDDMENNTEPLNGLTPLTRGARLSGRAIRPLE